jgi:hypothetical protein
VNTNKPLTHVHTKDHKFKFTGRCEQSFQGLKNKSYFDKKILTLPNNNKNFQLIMGW